jgi:hypothetical protein
MRPQKQTRNIPWFWLAAALLLYTLIGRLTASFWAITSAFTLALAWASASAWTSTLAWTLGSSWVSALLSAPAWVLTFTSFSGLLWFCDGLLGGGGGLVFTLIVAWAVFWVLTWAWALAVAGKELLKFFNQIHTFLILAGTSWLGLALGCLWRLALTRWNIAPAFVRISPFSP